jgi:hypothetical protein
MEIRGKKKEEEREKKKNLLKMAYIGSGCGWPLVVGGREGSHSDICRYASRTPDRRRRDPL